MAIYHTYHATVSGYRSVPGRSLSWKYTAEVPDELLTGDEFHDIEVILGHAWDRPHGRWESARENFHIRNIEPTATGIVFKVDVHNQPGFYMWIDNYRKSGPW